MQSAKIGKPPDQAEARAWFCSLYQLADGARPSGDDRRRRYLLSSPAFTVRCNWSDDGNLRVAA
jgi:hypothetical protein